MIAHKILNAAARVNRERRGDRLVTQLAKHGYDVALTPAA